MIALLLSPIYIIINIYVIRWLIRWMESCSKYFKNKDKAYAYKLGKVKVYECPKSLLDFGLRMAPQSFAYVK